MKSLTVLIALTAGAFLLFLIFIGEAVDGGIGFHQTHKNAKYVIDLGVLPARVRDYIDAHPGDYKIYQSGVKLINKFPIVFFVHVKKAPRKTEHLVVERTIWNESLENNDFDRTDLATLEIFHAKANDSIYYSNSLKLVDVIVLDDIVTVRMKNMDTFEEDAPKMVLESTV